MMGQGIMPQSYHPIASKLSGAELDHFLSSLRDTVTKTLKPVRDRIAKAAGRER